MRFLSDIATLGLPPAFWCLAGLACGLGYKQPAPDFVSANGVKWWLHGHDSYANDAQVNEMEAWYFERLPSFDTDKTAGTAVDVYDDDFPCGYPNGCHGQYRSWKGLVIGAEGACVYRSAYLHELTHELLFLVDHEQENQFHSRFPELWKVADGFTKECPA